jgi:putative protease
MTLTPSLAAPELLAPAGTLKNMRYAFAYGADAVYAGQPRYSLRVRNNEFDHANLALGIREAQMQGKRFYVVVNIAPHNAKLKTFLKDLAPVIEMAPDALIMSWRHYCPRNWYRLHQAALATLLTPALHKKH